MLVLLFSIVNEHSHHEEIIFFPCVILVETACTTAVLSSHFWTEIRTVSKALYSYSLNITKTCKTGIQKDVSR
jgi:hypothetical protein